MVFRVYPVYILRKIREYDFVNMTVKIPVGLTGFLDTIKSYMTTFHTKLYCFDIFYYRGLLAPVLSWHLYTIKGIHATFHNFGNRKFLLWQLKVIIL